MKDLLIFTLQHDWPCIKLAGIDKYLCDALKGVNVWDMYKESGLNIKL